MNESWQWTTGPIKDFLPCIVFLKKNANCKQYSGKSIYRLAVGLKKAELHYFSSNLILFAQSSFFMNHPENFLTKANAFTKKPP